MNDSLVNVSYKFLKEDYNFWEDNMQLAIMRPFSYLYERDDTPNKTTSSKEMVCIFFMSEPDPEKNKFYRMTYGERLSMLQETFYEEFDPNEEVIKECLDVYPALCLSSIKRAMKEEIDSMVARSEFIRNFDYSTQSLSDIGKLDAIRAKTPALLKNYEDIESKFLKEKDSARIEGGRKKSKSEKKQL